MKIKLFEINENILQNGVYKYFKILMRCAALQYLWPLGYKSLKVL